MRLALMAARGLAPVATLVVSHDYAAGGQGEGEDFLDIDQCNFAVDRSIDQPGRVNERQGSSSSEGIPQLQNVH